MKLLLLLRVGVGEAVVVGVMAGLNRIRRCLSVQLLLVWLLLLLLLTVVHSDRCLQLIARGIGRTCTSARTIAILLLLLLILLLLLFGLSVIICCLCCVCRC